MPPRFPEEVDVFTVPHSRMKYLVQMYRNQLSTTDFNNAAEMACFLSSLLETFKEFQQHEQIENHFIMDRLKRRLSALSVYNSAVCSCHQDNRLTEMLEMVQNGVAGEHGSERERQLFRCQLRQKLDEFTDNFLPHMEEEEQIFQPLLIKYFDYDELRELKHDVLQNHHLSEKADLPEKGAESAVPPPPVAVPRLPPELLTLIFAQLRPAERAACAAVCRRWHAACLAPSLWTSLRPVLAGTGARVSTKGDVIDELMLESASLKLRDLDADVDECEPAPWPGQRQDSVVTAQRRMLKRRATGAADRRRATEWGRDDCGVGECHKVNQMMPDDDDADAESGADWGVFTV
ncbi:F-box/LRR-repeat protein 5-like [Pollicipes pollicipes]|uniref:F-box/LRR-repeat protein 5-like n=1 Tax=Pollicipes pollicipes TaxID=41117 RepID=UPI001884B98E|nr:F-box/LRR-repeat protein 5-like [Pollicipes pollicipes]